MSSTTPTSPSFLHSLFTCAGDLDALARTLNLTYEQIAERAARPDVARAIATLRTLKAMGRLQLVSDESDSDETRRKAAVELLAMKSPDPAPCPTCADNAPALSREDAHAYLSSNPAPLPPLPTEPTA